MSYGQGLINGIFERNCSHLVFDQKLAKLVNQFQVSFVNKNEDHMLFFGGSLTGVQVVRFTTTDKDSWFSEIIQADESYLQTELAKIPFLDPDWHVSTDVFNYSCLWLIHKFSTSPYLDDRTKHQAMIDAALVLHYRFLTSLLFRYFKYPAERSTAEATYARLSLKFMLKKHGSWYRTLEARCEDLIEEGGLHDKTFKDFTDDLRIIYLVTDTQGRIRDMLKNIYATFKSIHDQGIRIKTTTSLVEHDGEQILKDRTKNLSNYTRYLHTVIIDKNSFIKNDLLQIIEKLMHTMNPKLFLKTLEWCSINYKHDNSRDVEHLIDETLIHSFNYLTENRTVLKDTTDLPGLLGRLRGVYMSSRSTDEDLLKIRRLGEKIIRNATGIKNENTISSIRTGLLLYLVLRAFTMNYYSR